MVYTFNASSSGLIASLLQVAARRRKVKSREIFILQPLELDETGNEPRPSSMLQALVMVARRLGVETTLTHLRRSYVVGGNEPSSDVVVAMARDLRLDARAVTLRWRDLPRLHKTLPSILRLTDGTALVLVAIRDNPESGRIAVLQDPTALPDAIMAIDESRLCEVWSGEVILVKRRYAVDEDRPFGFAWLFGQLLRERRLFREIGLAAIFSTVFALAPPFLFMIVLDRVLVNHSYSTLIVITVALTLLVVFEMAFSFLRRLFTEVATTRIDARLNIYIMEKLFRLRMDYFERHPTGEIMSKVAQIWKVRNFLTGQLFGTFIDAVPLLGLIPAMIIVEWRLSIFVFTLTGVIALIIYGFMPLLGRRFQKVVIAEQAKGAHLIENIYGMRTIKSMALEGRRRHDWDLRVAAAASARHDFGVVANYPQTLSLPFERLIYSGSLMLGAYMLLAHSDVMSAGALIAFSMLSMRLAQPLIQIARLQQDLGEAGGAIGELATVMNAPPEQTRAGTGLRLQVEGAISFQNLRFRYAPGAPYALDDVSFTIAPGMMFGIMGRSGSGKTTVTRLLQGLHADYEGIIKVDGMDLREIDLTHLRTSIGVVAQENFLFAGSIRENIAMARPDASFADIVRAAQMAGAEEFIERMPRGYETSLEEGAVNLSGGQRQRLAIARALLVDPPVLILDEATSALDAESEAIINANLQRIARGRTIICISHRLSMLVPANAVLVLERGQIYDIGSHDELLHRCDIYKHLWHQQNRHVERNAANIQLAVARPQQA